MNTEERRYQKINGMLSGQDCYIVGSGNSLKGFDLHRLDNVFTIAINHSIEFYPQANALIFGDKTFVKYSDFDFKSYNGMIFASQDSAYKKDKKDDRENVYIFRAKRDEPCLNTKPGLYHPNCSGLLALNLALAMKARRIFLLGYDFYYENKIMHFYGDKYEHHRRYEEKKFMLKIKKFRYFQEWEQKIFNCNPKSLLKTFQFLPYEDLPV